MDDTLPDVGPLLAQQKAHEEGVQARHDTLERLYDAAVAFAPLWLEWAQGGSKEGTELAGQVSSASARLTGAAVDLFNANKLP